MINNRFAVFQQTLNSQTICENTTPDKLTIAVSGGIGKYSFQWYSIGMNTNSGGTIISGSTDSIYTPLTNVVGTSYYYCNVKQTGLGCETTSAAFKVEVVPAPSFTNQPTSSSVCKDGTPTQLSVTYKNGTGTASYKWFSNTADDTSTGTEITGATLSTFNPPSSVIGTTYYYCIVTFSAGGCTSITSATAKVSINPLPTIAAQPLPTQTICVGGSIAALSISYTGGVGTPSYQWYSNTTSSNTGGTKVTGATNSSTFTPPPFNSVGNYYFYCEVTLTGNGCGSTVSNLAEVVVVPDPIIVEAPLLTQTLCQGALPDSLKIEVSGGVGSFAYQWYSNTVNNTSSGTLISGANKDAYLPLTTSVGTTYYYCLVTQPNGPGCNVTSPTGTVIVNLAPTFSSQPQSSTICKGEIPTMLSVTFKDGVGIASYQWYSNTINSYSESTAISGEINDSYNPPAINAGTFYYYCIITLPSGGCSSLISEIATITINQYPVVSDYTRLIGSGTSFTVAPSSASSADIVPVGTSYTWDTPIISPSNAVSGASAQSNPKSSISQTLTNNTKQVATATYIVHPVSEGCAGTDFKIKVTINPPISPNAIINDIDCYAANNGRITTNIVGGIPPYIISWNGPNNFTSTDSSISDLAPGAYSLKITDNGGFPFNDTYTVQEPLDIVLSTEIKKDLSCFDASDGQITISVTGGTPPYSYSWIKNSIPYDTTKNIIDLQAGEYKILVTDKNNCGPKTATYIINEPNEIVVTIISQKNLNCFGDTNGSISVDVSGGVPTEISPGIDEYNYLWSGPNEFKSNNKDISDLVAGLYTLVVIDKTGCSKNFSTYITQPDEINIDVTLTPVSCFGANDATIKIDISGGVGAYNIEWSNMAKGTYLKDLAPGTYTVTVNDSNSCLMTKDIVIDEAPFSIKPIQKNVSCFGAKNGSIILNIVGGVPPLSLMWSDDPNAGNSRNRLGPGKYTVTLTDAVSCPIVKSFTITEPIAINVVSNITNAFDCNIPSSGSINLVVSGGTEPYKFEWSNGQTTKDIMNIPAGIYEISITDDNGCNLIKQFEVLRQKPLDLSVEIVLDFNCGTKVLKDICTAKVIGGVPPYQFNWSSGTIRGTSSEIMETTQSGLVVLGVTDGLGCTSNYTFEVKVPTIGVSYNLLNCDKRLFEFDAIIPTGLSSDYTYLWNFGDGTTSTLKTIEHAYPSSGTYLTTLQISSSTCTSNFEKYIIVEGSPTLKLDKLPIFCNGDSILLHVSGAETYRWYNGSVGDSILINRIGDYSVTGTSKAGCTSTLDFTATNFDNYNYTIESDKNDLTVDNPSIELWSQNITYSDYFWNFGDGNIAQGNNQNHRYDPLVDGYFDVKLKVKNPNGCYEFASKRIWITNNSDANVFTPNGDGVDDVYMQGWHIQVFNRNGILLYDGKGGWDGTYKNSPVANDTYFWILYSSTVTGIKTRTGFVTVVR